MRRVLLIVLFLLASVPLYAKEKESIKIGISCDLSGKYGKVGKVYIDGWKAYFKKVNKENNGINGKKVEWKVLDDKGDPNKTVEKTKELLSWGADVLAGYVGPDCTNSAVDYIERKKIEIPLFFPLNGGRFIKENLREMIYSIDPTYKDEADILFSYFVTEKHTHNWGIVYDDSYFAEYVKRVLEEKLSEYALRPILVDISNEMAVTQLIEFWPDVIVIVMDPESTYNFVKRLADNIDARKMPSVVIVSSAALCENIKKISDIMPPNKFFFIQTTPHPKDTSYLVVREYLEALKRYMPGSKPCFISLHGYIAAKLMCNILAKAGNLSVYSISQVAEGIDNDIGIGKTIRFTYVIHRVPIGVGLFLITGKGPRIKEVMWKDFSYKSGDAGKEFGVEKKDSTGKTEITSKGREDKTVDRATSSVGSPLPSGPVSVSVDIKDVAPAN